MTALRLLEMDAATERRLISAARDERPIQGLTHNHYRYPARFSAVFARETIEAFTRPGDLVLDPHVGGGTTIVEAAAAGRDALGVDLSVLAEFVSSVKTTMFDEAELAALETWAATACRAVSMPDRGGVPSGGLEATGAWAGYRKHLDHPDRRPVADAITRGLATTRTLAARSQDFARCVILRSAQIALDGRRTTMDVAAFAALTRRSASQMIGAARTYAAAVARHRIRPGVDVIMRSAIGLENEPRVNRLGAPRLVLTSPPYPGVHVLYNRWQVGGGRETAAPLWIAEREDGAANSHYTMGDRRTHGRDAYFTGMRDVMRSVSALSDETTVIVQMLAFADAATQLPRYLATMEEAGLSESTLPGLVRKGDGRLWREVPNRRWYSDRRGATPASQEVVLFHTLRKPAVGPTARTSEHRAIRTPAIAATA